MLRQKDRDINHHKNEECENTLSCKAVRRFFHFRMRSEKSGGIAGSLSTFGLIWERCFRLLKLSFFSVSSVPLSKARRSD